MHRKTSERGWRAPDRWRLPRLGAAWALVACVLALLAQGPAVGSAAGDPSGAASGNELDRAAPAGLTRDRTPGARPLTSTPTGVQNTSGTSSGGPAPLVKATATAARTPAASATPSATATAASTATAAPAPVAAQIRVGVNVTGITDYGYGDILPYAPTSDVDADLSAIAAMGGGVIRVFAANHEISDDAAAQRLSGFLDKAAAHNIRVVVSLIDFYKSAYYPEGVDSYYTDSWNGILLLNDAFFQGGYKDRYLPFVRTVVAANQSKPNVYAWEYGNELKDEASPQALINFMNDVGSVIRSLDADTAISTGMLNAAHTGLTPSTLYPQLAYADLVSVHAFNGDRASAVDVDWARSNARRAFVEEFGFSGTGDRSGSVQTEVNYWSSRGAEAIMQWGFIAKGLPDNGNGDNIYGMDSIWHTDYDQLAAVYEQASSTSTSPTPTPTATATATVAATSTASPTQASTPSPTATSTPTQGAPTATATATATQTPGAVQTATPTVTPKATATSTVVATAPLAPSNLAVTGARRRGLTVTFTDNATNETGFRLERETGSSGSWAQVATLNQASGSGASISFNDNGLAFTTTYCYRVFAYNAAGDSPASNEGCGTTS